jgi:hypothetical protein
MNKDVSFQYFLIHSFYNLQKKSWQIQHNADKFLPKISKIILQKPLVMTEHGK